LILSQRPSLFQVSTRGKGPFLGIVAGFSAGDDDAAEIHIEIALLDDVCQHRKEIKIKAVHGIRSIQRENQDTIIGSFLQQYISHIDFSFLKSLKIKPSDLPSKTL
jgi:hypothetical protein